jgi:predicted amidophosphoribosyltransferase
MSIDHPRLARELHTIEAMIALYCREQHGTRNGLCDECRELLAYARARLARCPYQQGKTTCARCPVHCYKPSVRARIRVVMRYAGPRMLYRHPWLAVRHLFDGRRKTPIRTP